jgi:hypothetical protein
MYLEHPISMIDHTLLGRVLSTLAWPLCRLQNPELVRWPSLAIVCDKVSENDGAEPFD